jgi:2-dehydro-3-deoxygalactonokinase
LLLSPGLAFNGEIMRIGVIDCGSITTKLSIVDGELILIANSATIGTNSTLETGNNLALRQAIKNLIEETLQRIGLTVKDVPQYIAAGMISSELGLKLIPHMPAPASLDDMAKGLEILDGKEYLDLDATLYLVRGVINSVAAKDYAHLETMDLMRGEEVQAFGAMELQKISPPVNIVELGSTTKWIHIDAMGRLAGSITSLSGQIYATVARHTLLAGSLKDDGSQPFQNYWSEELLETAYRCVTRQGLLRSLFLIRSGQVSMKNPLTERKFYFSAALCCDDIRMFISGTEAGFDVDAPFVIAGNSERCRMYEYLLRNKVRVRGKISILDCKQDMEKLSVIGCRMIMSRLDAK